MVDRVPVRAHSHHNGPTWQAEPVTFTVTVDSTPWRAAALRTRDAVADAVGANGGIVPVVKGNGYGLGNASLASESARLGVPSVAVGTVFEAEEVAEAFSGDVVVLEPFDPRDSGAAQVWKHLENSAVAPRLIRTIASEVGWHAAMDEGTRQSTRPRVVVEALTSMHRFGLNEGDVARLLTDPRIADAVLMEGLALHLPLAQPPSSRPTTITAFQNTPTGIVEPGTARARETIAWSLLWTTLLADRLGQAASDNATTIWASHLDDSELRSVRSALPDTPLRARIGTRLWHGDRTALQAQGTVLEVHRTDREVGYRQRRAPKGGAIVVVSGGTSHGVALSAPASATSWRARANTAGSGALEASGRARSPFTLRGEQLWFAEPPHVSVSMLRVPRGLVPPNLGDELPCVVRYTTTRADRVVWT